MISHAYYSSPGSLRKTILKKIRKESVYSINSFSYGSD